MFYYIIFVCVYLVFYQVLGDGLHFVREIEQLFRVVAQIPRALNSLSISYGTSKCQLDEADV